MGEIDRKGFISKRDDVLDVFREWCETEKPTQEIIDNVLSVVKNGLENKKKEYSEELIINETDAKSIQRNLIKL